MLGRGKVRAFVDGLFDSMLRRERSDSRQCHHPVGSATECGELEDPPYARTIGNAIHLAVELHGRAGDTLQDPAANEAAWFGSPSKCDLNFFKELFPLRLRKANDEPSEARQ